MTALILALSLVAHAEDPAEVSTPLVVEETLWGFGTATARVFNQVAVQVRNDTGVAYDGQIALKPVDSIGFNTVDTSVVRDIYIAPGESRWVSFGVYLGDNNGEWSLHWDAFGEAAAASAPLSKASFRHQRVVAVTDRNAGLQLPTFPPARFPTKSTLLDAVHILVFPEAPRWQPGQERALAGWLARGGRVLIGSDAGGWAGPLTALNRPTRIIRFGGGTVIRGPKEFRGLTDEEVRQFFIPTAGSNDLVIDEVEGGTNRSGSLFAWDLDGEVLLSLQSAITPRSLAWLYYPMLIAYCAAVVYLAVRSVRDRWSARRYLTTFAAVVLFACVGFAFASPLSFADSSASLSLTFATDLGEAASDRSAGQLDRVDLRYFGIQRTPLSRNVALGESAASAPEADEELFAIEAVGTRSTVMDGRSQTLEADIPGLVNAVIRRRAIVDYKMPRWKVDRSRASPNLVADNVEAKSVRPIAALLQTRHEVRRVHAANLGVDDVVTTKTVRSYLVNPSMNWWGYRHHPKPYKQSDRLLSIIDAAGRALPAYHQTSGRIRPQELVLPTGIARIFVLARCPASLLPPSDTGPRRDAYVVWCQQIEEEIAEDGLP